MAEKKVVLVTGVAGYWGARLAARLAENPALNVIGMDRERPEQEIKGLDFIQSDIRNPLLLDLLKTEQVHTLYHLAFNETRHPSESAFDYNVIGTMKVFGACCQAGVRRIVFKSSTSVYGACATNSAFLREEHALRGGGGSGSARDLVEIEAFCNGYRRQAPELDLIVLRFPYVIGPSVDSELTRYLNEPAPLTLMGFDPLMQVIHEEDVVEALAHAMCNGANGVYNVAAEGNLPLRKIIGLTGKIPVPVFHLFAYWGFKTLNSAGVKVSSLEPLDLDSLRYPFVSDIARMRDEFCFTPRYTAEEALREYAGFQRTSPFKQKATDLDYDADRLRDTLERRRRTKEPAPPCEVNGLNGEEELEEI